MNVRFRGKPTRTCRNIVTPFYPSSCLLDELINIRWPCFPGHGHMFVGIDEGTLFVSNIVTGKTLVVDMRRDQAYSIITVRLVCLIPLTMRIFKVVCSRRVALGQSIVTLLFP